MNAKKHKPTAAALARELHAADPTAEPAELARAISARLKRRVLPSQVREAIAAAGRPSGRQRRAPQTERVHLTLDAAILARVRAEGERSGYSVAELLEGAWLAAETEDAISARVHGVIARARAANGPPVESVDGGR